MTLEEYDRQLSWNKLIREYNKNTLRQFHLNLEYYIPDYVIVDMELKRIMSKTKDLFERDDVFYKYINKCP